MDQTEWVTNDGFLVEVTDEGVAHFSSEVPFEIFYQLDTYDYGPFFLNIQKNGGPIEVYAIDPGAGHFSGFVNTVPRATGTTTSGPNSPLAGQQAGDQPQEEEPAGTYQSNVDAWINGPDGIVPGTWGSDRDYSADIKIGLGDIAAQLPFSYDDVQGLAGPAGQLSASGIASLFGNYVPDAAMQAYLNDPSQSYDDYVVQMNAYIASLEVEMESMFTDLTEVGIYHAFHSHPGDHFFHVGSKNQRAPDLASFTNSLSGAFDNALTRELQDWTGTASDLIKSHVKVEFASLNQILGNDAPYWMTQQLLQRGDPATAINVRLGDRTLIKKIEISMPYVFDLNDNEFDGTFGVTIRDISIENGPAKAGGFASLNLMNRVDNGRTSIDPFSLKVEGGYDFMLEKPYTEFQPFYLDVRTSDPLYSVGNPLWWRRVFTD